MLIVNVVLTEVGKATHLQVDVTDTSVFALFTSVIKTVLKDGETRGELVTVNRFIWA